MVRRRRLASELRRLREAADLTCGQVAALLDCSGSKISRIETGRLSVSPRDVRDLLEIYGVPADQRDNLIQLARESRQKGWWQGFGEGVEPHLATYIGMETEACDIRHYSVGRVPTLLQTEDHARAVVTAGRAKSDGYPAPAENMVQMMMERQRLAKACPPNIWVVLEETVLRRQVGGREVAREQIRHLIEVSSTPTTFVQCIPFSAGAHVVMDLPFVILGFPHPADPDIAAIGYATGVVWIEDVAEVDRYNMLFHNLQAAALPFDASAALMTSIFKEM